MTTEPLVRKAALSGGTASVASALALALCGKLELDDPYAPLNGPSQWLFGIPAAFEGGFSLKHTVSGYLIHHAMSILWAFVFERLRAKPALATKETLLPAVATSALACLVDFQLTPDRLTPGFERRLSRKSLAIVYATFAIGLTAGAAIGAARRR